jgi:DNA-binding beta-propeller fold protein YncE
LFFHAPLEERITFMSLSRSAPFVAAAALVAVASASSAQVSGLTGTIVVTNKSPATATIIDVGSGRTLGTLPTGQGPHEIAITRDGRTAVVTDYGAQGPGGNTLTVIDVPGRRVVRTIDLGQYRRPHGISFLPGDSLVVVTSEASRNVVIVNVAEGAIRKAIGTTQNGSHMVGVVADGSRMYTGNIGSNTVSELDGRSGEFVKTFEVPAQPEAINVTPDGAEVWVGRNGTGKVSVLDPRTGNVTTAAEGLGWPYRVLYTPDRTTVMLPDLRNEELRFLDRASRKELSRLTFKGGGPQGITITPDGKYIFQSLSTQGRVAIIDVAKRTVVGHLEAGQTPDGVVYTTQVSR